MGLGHTGGVGLMFKLIWCGGWAVTESLRGCGTWRLALASGRRDSAVSWDLRAPGPALPDLAWELRRPVTRASGGWTKPYPPHSSCHFWEDFFFVESTPKYGGPVHYRGLRQGRREQGRSISRVTSQTQPSLLEDNALIRDPSLGTPYVPAVQPVISGVPDSQVHICRCTPLNTDGQGRALAESPEVWMPETEMSTLKARPDLRN